MRRRIQVIAVAAALSLAPGISAQEWKFQTYFQGKPWGAATFHLTQGTPGEYKARFTSDQGLHECISGELRATVQQQGG